MKVYLNGIENYQLIVENFKTRQKTLKLDRTFVPPSGFHANFFEKRMDVFETFSRLSSFDTNQLS